MDEKTHFTTAERVTLLRHFACFAKFSLAQLNELASVLEPMTVAAGSDIVTENDLIDAVYIIAEGKAEVTRLMKHRHKQVQVPIAVLNAGEGIGLHDLGFYSTTGKRTATVTAITRMVLLRLEVKALYSFLHHHQLDMSMEAASLQMLRMQFIKQSLPFAKLSTERLQWLADQVEEVTVSAGDTIFEEGDVGNQCYLIRSGKIEIIHKAEKDEEKRLALLRAPVLFGEATLITHSTRNATARAVEDSELFILNHAHLSELIESEDKVASMFMTLMVDRSRPLQAPGISEHIVNTADGQEITILKNPQTHGYFKLAQEGAFVWSQLDGQRTLEEITLDLAKLYNVFAPDMVAALISRLNKGGFVTNVNSDDTSAATRSPWIRMVQKMRQVMEWRWAIGDADRWLSKIYDNYVRYLFTTIGQCVLASLAVIGLLAFGIVTPDVFLFFSVHHASLLLVLGLIPLSIVAIVLHELGHAFTAKAYGREVHYMGVGWNWITPIAFTDTSDMWLSPRKPRMVVNFAGIYVDILVGGFAALLSLFISNPYAQGMLWLFALYTYLGGFRMLSPLQAMDGYYILSDWLEMPRLREAAVLWLLKFSPRSLLKWRQLKYYKAEATYWFACLLYVLAITFVTLLLQLFIFDIFGIVTNVYIAMILPVLIVIFSSFGIIADIRARVE